MPPHRVVVVLPRDEAPLAMPSVATEAGGEAGLVSAFETAVVVVWLLPLLQDHLWYAMRETTMSNRFLTVSTKRTRGSHAHASRTLSPVAAPRGEAKDMLCCALSNRRRLAISLVPVFSRPRFTTCHRHGNMTVFVAPRPLRDSPLFIWAQVRKRFISATTLVTLSRACISLQVVASLTGGSTCEKSNSLKSFGARGHLHCVLTRLTAPTRIHKI
mmetsp:Transcript_23627/g.48325  ORF Transcript_23627/g.48325 Transcript_23627/m.48325 type:complete len:215 (-) Transcript_23627:71-715(-)